MRRAIREVLAICGAAVCTSAWAAGIPDHLKCYKVRDPLSFRGVLDVDTPQFGVDPGCVVSKAKLFCVPATKVVQSVENKLTGPITPLPVQGAPTVDDRVCYKLKCPVLPTDQQVTDQFGTRTLDLTRTSLVCTPAVKGTTYCGDGVKNGTEECDGNDLGGETCGSEGFTSGTATCGAGCVLDTGGCSCGGGNAFPATGQTTCWDTVGTVIPCAGTGQDGDIQAGATLSYVDNGDGTVTDINTGLMWEKKSDDGSIHDKDQSYSWASALGVHVAMLNQTLFAGYSDWRLPNARELETIRDYQQSDPMVSAAFNSNCAPGCSVLQCSCTRGLFPLGGGTQASYYWTSTTFAGSTDGNPVNIGAGAFVVAFSHGTLNIGYVGGKAEPSFFARAVRGGS